MLCSFSRRRRPQGLSALGVCWFVVSMTLAGFATVANGEFTDPAAATAPRVVVLRLAMPIHPIAAEHVERGLQHAAAIDAVAVVVELDTPGGSLPATRRLVQVILGSEVPVVVWVGPAGAQAASAGFFVLLAADVVAMAPGTNTGAAHPVAGSGEDIDGDMGKKIEEDTLALARSIAGLRHRDPELAQSAVRDSRSFTAEEALASGLADIQATDIRGLLAALDGRARSADPAAAPGDVWHTRGAVVERHELAVGKRLLAALAHPQIAGLLMALGMLGLYVEISNPGLILPGTFGAIALVLGCFALSVLPIDTAGLALLGLALVLLIAETQVPTFGVLTLGGAVSLVLGLSMLFDDMGPALALHPGYPIALGLMIAAVGGFTSWQTWRWRRQPPTTGRDGMVGERGKVRLGFVANTAAATPGSAPFRGKVFVHGELWTAFAETPLVAGVAVEVESVDGLALRVRPVPMPPPPGSHP